MNCEISERIRFGNNHEGSIPFTRTFRLKPFGWTVGCTVSKNVSKGAVEVQCAVRQK